MQRLLPLAEETTPASAPPPFSLLIVDLDQFKPINDLYGHATGDMVLTEVAARMRAVCKSVTMVARLGGDEFVAVVENAERAAVTRLAGRLRDAISRPFETGRREIELSASIGIAHYPDNAISGRDLMKCADRALYVAKSSPTTSIVSYSPGLDAAETERQELIRRLPKALTDGEIELHFQPIVDASTGRCHTAEALLRWTHPERGSISPEVVISIAEESQQIKRLGNWIIERALQTASRWPCSVSVAVNLSASQFKYLGFGAAVGSMLKATGVAPERLELELTETLLCSDEAIATIHELRAMGVRMSLDDFGTGYASMSYLLRIPFDRVKIDRSFVEQVDRRRDRRIIVEAVASLATKLGLEIVAEGVETAAERVVVEAAGCRYLQGYLFAKPLPEKELMAFLSAQACEPGQI
jgi:diguanylate cyclase (GGDEF)-like protein